LDFLYSPSPSQTWLGQNVQMGMGPGFKRRACLRVEQNLEADTMGSIQSSPGLSWGSGLTVGWWGSVNPPSVQAPQMKDSLAMQSSSQRQRGWVLRMCVYTHVCAHVCMYMHLPSHYTCAHTHAWLCVHTHVYPFPDPVLAQSP
jgi:hypothetical protein